jgi:uncharacterized repeat protein (TIGR02543 family)
MKNTIKAANKIILVSLLAMALAFSIIGCGDPADTTDSAGDGECTVNFNLDGGNINGDTSSVQIQVKKGTTIDNLPTPQKANNTFGGWFTGTNGSGNEFKTTTEVTSNRTVFAKWTYSGTEGRTVTFDMDGGNIDGNTAFITVTVQSGGTIASLPTPQKASNTFGGWYTERNGGGNAFTASTQVTSTITVYAKWTAITAGNFPPFELNGIQVLDFIMNSGSVGMIPGSGNYNKNFLLTYQEDDAGVSISNLIENPNVKLINGKLSIYFDKPKNWNPQSGKIFVISLAFRENDNNDSTLGYGRYGISSLPGGSVWLLYTEEAITLTKDNIPEELNMVNTYFSTVNINLNLNPGWNFMFVSYEDMDTVNITGTKPDDNFNWYLYVWN